MLVPPGTILLKQLSVSEPDGKTHPEALEHDHDPGAQHHEVPYDGKCYYLNFLPVITSTSLLFPSTTTSTCQHSNMVTFVNTSTSFQFPSLTTSTCQHPAVVTFVQLNHLLSLVPPGPQPNLRHATVQPIQSIVQPPGVACQCRSTATSDSSTRTLVLCQPPVHSVLLHHHLRGHGTWHQSTVLTATSSISSRSIELVLLPATCSTTITQKGTQCVSII